MNEIKTIIKNLHDLDYNPVEIESMLKHCLEEDLAELLEKEYTTIIFDSPLGVDSEILLKEKHYVAKWYGPKGCRGLTYVYIPKKDKYFRMERFEDLLDELDLRDGGTHIIVK